MTSASGAESHAHAAGALRTCFRIAAHWHLADADCQRLLDVSPETLARWRADADSAEPTGETLERLSHLLSIWADLQVVLPRAQAADTWLQRPNDGPLFGGHTPLEHLRCGRLEALAEVARYLRAWRNLQPPEGL